MLVELSKSQIDLIKESLRYTIMAFEDYKNYPSEEFKRQRIEEATECRSAVGRNAYMTAKGVR